jgi:nucleotide-binding universal stress UspA family protein
MLNIKKILCPIDFSETSEEALKYAIQFAKAFSAHIDIVHILFDETQVVAFYLPQTTFQNMENEITQATKEQFKELINKYPDLTYISHSTKIIKGTPFLEIIKYAKDCKSDMIVIGTHGRTGLEHVLFGSTAEKVVRKAPCPVLTVRKENQKFKMP